MSQTHLDMAGLIDHLTGLFAENFQDQVASIYFGDIGLYPPAAFQAPNGESRAALVFDPRHDRVDSRAPNATIRSLGLNVVVLIDMMPHLEARPVAAFGERELVNLTTRIRTFLDQDAAFSLGGRVLSSSVGDINWEWVNRRKDTTMRAGSVFYEVKVKVPRM